MQSHRLGNLGPRSNRHTDRGNQNTGFFQTQQPTRPARSSNFYERPVGNNTYPVRQGQPNQRTQNGGPSSVNARPLNHPFQLGNTLAGISYNQRNQRMRSHPNQGAVSAGSSRSAGGVGIQSQSQSSGSSVSSGTVRGGDAGRRKRALSISSDVSYE